MSRRSRLALWMVGVLVAAGVAGVVVGLGVGALYAAQAPEHETWADLAAVIMGLLAGGAVALLVWSVGTVLVVRRFVAPGRRLAVLGWSALAVVVTAAVGAALRLVDGGALAASDATWAAIAGATTAAVLAPPVVLAIREARQPD
ncbi:hypothetical protein [Cellulomonas carbonis]|nr:hypothetical protein [Cellulomonas carbonis]GGC02151.1 hypothetical protein GCM10010972_13880 [Cellulomonas carbonis]